MSGGTFLTWVLLHIICYLAPLSSKLWQSICLSSRAFILLSWTVPVLQIGDEIGADELVRRLKTLAHTFQGMSQVRSVLLSNWSTRSFSLLSQVFSTNVHLQLPRVWTPYIVWESYLSIALTSGGRGNQLQRICSSCAPSIWRVLHQQRQQVWAGCNC